MNIIKVSGTSRTSAVAGAIAGVFRENKRAEVQAIGAGAVNQAVKALVLAKGYLQEDGYDVVFSPEFVDVEIEDKVRTAVKLTVELRYPDSQERDSTDFEIQDVDSEESDFEDSDSQESEFQENDSQENDSQESDYQESDSQESESEEFESIDIEGEMEDSED